MKALTSRMQVWPLLLFMILCLAGPLMAQEAPPVGDFLESLGGLEKAAKAGDRLLFYELPKGVEAAEGTTLDIRVQHQGRLFVHEKLTLGAVEPGARPAVEILGWNPEKLDELWRLAEEPGSRVRISVAVEGRQMANLSFEQLARQNESLRQWEFQPVPATSEILAPRASSPGVPLKTTREECANQCYAEYEACEARADPFDPHNEYAICQDALHQCETFCHNCPVAGSTQTQVVVLSIRQTGSYPSCYLDYRLGSQGWQYYPVDVNYRKTVYRRITNCDYTTTTQVLSVTYYNAPCWGRTNTPCNPHGLRTSCGIEAGF